MTVEEDIEATLFGLVSDLAFDRPVPIAWPNETFAPPVGATHLRVTHLPNRTTRLYVGPADPHLRQGVLQIVVATALNVGPTTATRMAGTIAEQFPADRTEFGEAVKLRVQAAPNIGQAVAEDAFWVVPISVRYDVLI